MKIWSTKLKKGRKRMFYQKVKRILNLGKY